MRMRRKRYLDKRIDSVNDVLLVQQGYDFYDLTEEEKVRKLDFNTIFGNSNKIHLEIGCGKGGFITAISQKHPDINFLAVEKLSNVIVEACEQTLKQNVNNVRFLNCGAENLLYFLPEHSIECIYLNFSCPYPKKSYANRRLTNYRFLEKYKKLLTEQGVIKLKTDNLDFFNYSIEQFNANGFQLFDITNDLHNSALSKDNIVTEYESKFMRLGIPINYLCAKPID